MTDGQKPAEPVEDMLASMIDAAREEGRTAALASLKNTAALLAHQGDMTIKALEAANEGTKTRAVVAGQVAAFQLMIAVIATELGELDLFEGAK